MKKYPQVRRVRRPEYNEKAPFLVGVWQFIIGTFIWIAFIVIAGITIYAHWFTQAVQTIWSLFSPRNLQIPLSFSIICTIFLFPLTLIVLLASMLIAVFRGK
jgi:hypothetical protein